MTRTDPDFLQFINARCRMKYRDIATAWLAENPGLNRHVKTVINDIKILRGNASSSAAPAFFVATPPEKQEQTWEEKADGATFAYKGDANITNLEEALAFSKVDLKVWEVERHTFNTWTTTYVDSAKNAHQKWNVQVKVWFKKITVTPVDSVIDRLQARLKDYVRPVYARKRPDHTPSEHAALLNLFDAHIDKVAFSRDHGGIAENVRVFQGMFDRLLDSCVSYRPELIIFPVGNDFFHTNGPENRTKKAGHMLDVNAQHEDSFVLGVELLCKCIDKASQVAPVKVVLVKANHSEDKDFYLGQVLKAFYRMNGNVTVDCGMTQRKYLQYGACMLAFAHGDKERGKVAQLPLMMALEAKDMWASTAHRTFYLGDIHHKQEYQFMRTKDFAGADVRFLRSIGTDDRWHSDFSYVGVPKTAECHIWSKTDGLIATFMTNR